MNFQEVYLVDKEFRFQNQAVQVNAASQSNSNAFKLIFVYQISLSASVNSVLKSFSETSQIMYKVLRFIQSAMRLAFTCSNLSERLILHLNTSHMFFTDKNEFATEIFQCIPFALLQSSKTGLRQIIDRGNFLLLFLVG